MRKQRLAFVLLAMFICSQMTPLVFAQGSTNYRIPSDVQGAGGGDEAKSSNYMLLDTIGEPNIGPSRTANYDVNAGYRQTLETFISISGPPSVSIGTIVGTGQQTGSGVWTVITDATAGYSLSWTATGTDMVSGANTIGPFTPSSPNVPDTWTVAAADSEWGGRLRSDSTDTALEWGVNGVSDKWLNIATSARTIVTRGTRTSLTGSLEAVQFRAEIGTLHVQPNGTYSVTVIMTAVSL